MTDPLLHVWSLNLGYAKRLVADIADDKMALQPAPGMNHAAWVLGHLACTADMLGAMIGVKPVCPPEWTALFDWNSSPSSDASQYPPKATLLKALEDAHLHRTGRTVRRHGVSPIAGSREVRPSEDISPARFCEHARICTGPTEGPDAAGTASYASND